MSKRGLTGKQRAFAEAYVETLNATEAARQAGYKQPHVQGPRMLSNVSVKLEIDLMMARRAERVELSQEMILEELMKIGFANIHDFVKEGGGPVDLGRLTRDQCACIKEITVDTVGEAVVRTKIGFWDKRQTLIDLGKHMGMFVDKSERKLTGDLNVNYNPVGARDLLTERLAAFAESGSDRGVDQRLH